MDDVAHRHSSQIDISTQPLLYLDSSGCEMKLDPKRTGAAGIRSALPGAGVQTQGSQADYLLPADHKVIQ